MRLLFLDESGKLGQGGLFALGGIALRDRDWPELRDRWHETLAAHRWPLDRELKWHGIRKGEVPPALADAVYDTLAASPFTAYVTVSTPTVGRRSSRPTSMRSSARRRTSTRPPSCSSPSATSTCSPRRATSA